MLTHYSVLHNQHLAAPFEKATLKPEFITCLLMILDNYRKGKLIKRAANKAARFLQSKYRCKTNRQAVLQAIIYMVHIKGIACLDVKPKHRCPDSTLVLFS